MSDEKVIRQDDLALGMTVQRIDEDGFNGSKLLLTDRWLKTYKLRIYRNDSFRVFTDE